MYTINIGKDEDGDQLSTTCTFFYRERLWVQISLSTICDQGIFHRGFLMWNVYACKAGISDITKFCSRAHACQNVLISFFRKKNKEENEHVTNCELLGDYHMDPLLFSRS